MGRTDSFVSASRFLVTFRFVLHRVPVGVMGLDELVCGQQDEIITGASLSVLQAFCERECVSIQLHMLLSERLKLCTVEVFLKPKISFCLHKVRRMRKTTEKD